MKMMKKVATLLLALCLIVPGVSMVAHAVSGQIMFTDPETAVGQTLELKGVLKADSNIEDRKISMTYDTTMLKFLEGENVTETSSGQLTYEVTGKKDTNRVEFIMKFSVLKEGTTKVEVASYEAWTTGNDEINCTKGSSTIKIAEGDGTAVAPQEPVETTGVTVDVNGKTYTLASTFEDSVIPRGFAKTEFDYQGTMCTAVANENATMFLAYLVDEEGAGEFFLYMMDTATFVKFEAIEISDVTTIALLSDTMAVTLPEQFMTTEVIVNGTAYPAWQSTEDTAHCILYALNSNGEKALYQYDVTEGTYQRFTAPEAVEEQEDESMLTKVTALLEGNMAYVVLGVGLGFILLVLIIIILGVKLHNRNAELDEIYEEYGIDLDEEDDVYEEENSNVIKRVEEDSDEEVEVEFYEEESEGIFVDIDDEIEEDIMFTEDDEEVEVEFFEQATEEPAVAEETKEFDVEDIEMALEKISFASEENFEEASYGEENYDDDEDYDNEDLDDDFEMSFIDLDD